MIKKLIIFITLFVMIFSTMNYVFGLETSSFSTEEVGTIELIEPKVGLNEKIEIRDDLYVSVRVTKKSPVSISLERLEGRDIVKGLRSIDELKEIEKYNEAGIVEIVDAYIASYKEKIDKEMKLKFISEELSQIKSEYELNNNIYTKGRLMTVESDYNNALLNYAQIVEAFDLVKQQFENATKTTVLDSTEIRITGILPYYKKSFSNLEEGSYRMTFTNVEDESIIKSYDFVIKYRESEELKEIREARINTSFATLK